MNPSLDNRLDATTQRFAPAIRREARKQLGAEDYAVLQQTAIDQLALIEVAQAIHARHQCGHGFQVWGLPYNGLSFRDQMALWDALDGARYSDCPAVIPAEAARMIGASERLGRTAGLEQALEALATWVARSVASHELRHVADHEDLAVCSNCPPLMDSAARSELAGYLASFAVRGTANLALLQACKNRENAGNRSDAHGAAMSLIEERLLRGGCEDGPPHDLISRATVLARELYGQRLPIRIPRQFPSTLPILPRGDLDAQTSGPLTAVNF